MEITEIFPKFSKTLQHQINQFPISNRLLDKYLCGTNSSSNVQVSSNITNIFASSILQNVLYPEKGASNRAEWITMSSNIILSPKNFRHPLGWWIVTGNERNFYGNYISIANNTCKHTLWSSSWGWKLFLQVV